jgi:hypothetical protein
MNVLSYISELETMWVNRRDPRAMRTLSVVLWRASVALGVCLVAAAWVYAGFLVVVPVDSTLPTDAPARPAASLDKTGLTAVIGVFDQRAKKADALRNAPPAVQDPGRPVKVETKKTGKVDIQTP